MTPTFQSLAASANNALAVTAVLPVDGGPDTVISRINWLYQAESVSSTLRAGFIRHPADPKRRLSQPKRLPSIPNALPSQGKRLPSIPSALALWPERTWS